MASPQVTSFGTPTLVRATSGSVTGSWGTGQNRTAGHQLVAAVTAGGTTASAAALSTPSGWTQKAVISNTPTTANAWVAFYTKTAAGSDSAPAFTATLTGTVAMTCTLFELAAANDIIPVDVFGSYASGGSTGTLSAMTVATAGPVSLAGEYAISCYVQEASAATNTWNGPGGSWSNAANDGATSSVLHTAVDVQSNPSSGAILSETGHWTTNATAFGAALILVLAPQAAGIELFTNDGSTTISSGGTTAPAAGTPELWTAGSWSSFPTASPTVTPRTKFHVADPASPGELIEVVNTATGLVIRGAEGTTPVSHTTGFTVQNVMSAGSVSTLPPVVNARSVQFGAKGDGVTDDTAALQAMLNAAGEMGAALAANATSLGAGGYRVSAVAQIPPGIYKVTPPSATVPALTVPPNVTIDGINGAQLLKNGNGILLEFSGPGPISQTSNFNLGQGLRNITLNGNGFTGLLLRLYYMQDYLEENVYLTNNADVSVDCAQLWDSRFNNGLYLGGGSASSSAISGGQAVTHLIRNSAAPSTTLSAGVSGTITALPVAALPAALPAGVVQVWNAAGQLQNFTTTGAAISATSIPVTSTVVAHPFVTGNAVNGFGYSGDSSNSLFFEECHWENQLSGSIWLTPGVNSSDDLNFIFFAAMKCEQDAIGYNCPQIQVDAGDGIYFRGVQGYAGGFNGGYSTPVPFMKFNANFGAVSDLVLTNGSACLTTGITCDPGTEAALIDIFYYWSFAPTSGTATTLTGGYTFVAHHYAGGSFTNGLTKSGGATATLLGDQFGDVALGGWLQLAAGTTTAAPLYFTSGTLETTVEAGTMEFDGKAFYATSVASSRQVVATEQFQMLSSTRTFANNTSAQAIFNATTNGALTVQASTTYQFECMLNISSFSSSSHTINFGLTGLTGTAATFTNVEYVAIMANTAGGTPTTISENVGTAAAITNAVTGTVLNGIIRGVMRINAGGTVTPALTQVTASAAAIVQAGSFFRCWPVGSNTVTAVGDWS